jgi:hypothetical protein
MLAIDILIQLEFALDSLQRVRFGMENKVHVITAVQGPGHVTELPSIPALDLFDLAPSRRRSFSRRSMISFAPSSLPFTFRTKVLVSIFH